MIYYPLNVAELSYKENTDLLCSLCLQMLPDLVHIRNINYEYIEEGKENTFVIKNV